MATTACDCIQNSECWQQWARLYPPEGCCGCCPDYPKNCGTCIFEWTERTISPYLNWEIYSDNCADIQVGHYRCRCSEPTEPGVKVGDRITTNCDKAYITPLLFRKGNNLIGIGQDALKQRLGVCPDCKKQAQKTGCGSCGKQVRQQATTNEVRKEALATTPRRKLF